MRREYEKCSNCLWQKRYKELVTLKKSREKLWKTSKCCIALAHEKDGFVLKVDGNSVCEMFTPRIEGNNAD